MKIQFIICGWHMNRENSIDALHQLKEQNKGTIDVFWSCHRKPPKNISERFDYKEFFNGAEEYGAYQQAIDYLDLEDDTICFFLHDDLIIKDWGFINKCLDYLNKGYKVVGNGINYGVNLNPNEIKGGVKHIDRVKSECKYLFTSPLLCYTVRESFMCIRRGDLRKIGDFEVVWEEPIPDKDGKFHIGGIGNTQQALLGYKLTKFFGIESVAYLSNNHQDSHYLYECSRGKNKLKK